jgi:hypothetical protein
MSERLRRQVRILAECGERSPAIGALLGVSTKTVKRLYQRSHTHVTTGRPPGASPRWFGRDRERFRRVLQAWIDALPQLLAGDAPQVLARLTLQSGLPSPAHLAALLAHVQVGVDMAVRRCAQCQAPFVAFLARGRVPFQERCCPQPQCRQQFARRARRAAG